MRIVAIGGGTGLFTLLSGLKEHPVDITAIVTTFDIGGSTGILQAELGLLPAGDIRRCLIALAESKELMYELFNYRFTKGKGLEGHSFGNLLIAALTDLNKGDFKKTIEQFSKILAIKGRVLPATLSHATLCAKLADGTVIEKESEIDGYIAHTHIIDFEKLRERAPIDQVFLKPKNPSPLKETLKAIRSADLIVLGPGSMYTSIIPNLLVKGVSNAIRKSRAKKVYVCNITSQPGETVGWNTSQHVKEIEKYLGKGSLDYVIINTGKFPSPILKKYEREDSFLIKYDFDGINAKVIKGDIIKRSKLIRHDPKKLAKLVLSLK